MTGYLLDSNILSYLEDQTSPYHQTVKEAIEEHTYSDQYCI